MEHQPTDILVLLSSFLTLKDVLALATTSKNLKRKLLSPEVNRSLAIHFGFPFGLSLVELKQYEKRSLRSRLIAALEIGDMRITERLVELGAKDYNRVMIGAAQVGNKEIVKKMLKSRANDYNRTMISAAKGGHKEIVEWMLKLGAKTHDTTMVSAAQRGT
jgi:hypothetical protein